MLGPTQGLENTAATTWSNCRFRGLAGLGLGFLHTLLKVRRYTYMYTKVEGTTVTTVVQTLYSVLYRSLKLLGSLTKGCCYSYKYKS